MPKVFFRSHVTLMTEKKFPSESLAHVSLNIEIDYETIHVFQLSTEDLSQCRTSIGDTCFRGIQQVKSKLYLASVEDPVPIIEDIAGLDKTEVSLLPNGALSEPLNPEAGKYVFINFEDDSTESRASKLSRHDQLITKLITKLNTDLSEQNVKLMIIYTGRSAEHQRRVARQAVSQAPSTSSTTSATTSATTTTTTASTRPKQSTDGIFWQRPRLLMYYLALQTIADGTGTNIDVTAITLNEWTADKTGVSMTAGANTFAFNITGEHGYWWVSEFTWNNEALLSNTRVSAVDTFSFHCSPSIQLSNKNVVIRWTGLQIQPKFGTVAEQEQAFNSFGDSWDCVGFVSPGIVGGLFVVIMLLFILSIGISWMMDINTMDRFDDPKGKTITISVNE